VEAVGSAGPELDDLRRDPESRPVLRSRDRAFAETSLNLDYPLLKIGIGGERFALARCPGPDLAPPSPCGEVSIGFLGGDRRNTTLDTYLYLERLPVKTQRGVRVLGQL
jgi:hypothetical protein